MSKPTSRLPRISSLFSSANSYAGILLAGLSASPLCLAQEQAVQVEHEAVHAQLITRTTVTQVVVSDARGNTYVMLTLRPMSSDKVLVTSAMARMAKPFSVMTDQFQSVQSLSEVACRTASDSAPTSSIQPGIKEAYSHYTNEVYEVVYQQGGRWMSVEMLQEPVDGKLVLTEALTRSARPL